jgi:hypothetical protein
MPEQASYDVTTYPRTKAYEVGENPNNKALQECHNSCCRDRRHAQDREREQAKQHTRLRREPTSPSEPIP